VKPGSDVQTDGWSGYNQLQPQGYLHQQVILSAQSDPAYVSIPGVHRVACLLKRWIGIYSRIWKNLLFPGSVNSCRRIAQALDPTAVQKIPA